MLTQQNNYFNSFPMSTNSYPSHLIDDLNEINKHINDPYSWLTGQFIKIVLNLNSKTKSIIQNSIKKKNIRKPYFG